MTYKKGVISVDYIATQKTDAVIFTKGLPGPRYKEMKSFGTRVPNSVVMRSANISLWFLHLTYHFKKCHVFAARNGVFLFSIGTIFINTKYVYIQQ